MLLTWCWKQDGCAGRAAPMPDGCDAHVCTERDPDQNGHDIWRWSAGWPNGQASQSDYATERQAQLACEAALVRLGILPLPEWTARDATLAHIVAPTGELWAEARRAGPIGYTWELLSIWDACGDVITFDEAQAAAERHLRAEYAAWLEAQAAKEGAP